ncbi:hypothetical protein C2G38_2214682 [Gigaspora rosea]|uniref:Uncharacterized protein n=1 Tax=Gigaspora rosea TaxID=44941 RepID=A0A397UCJ2_9GLOM|nr:hypothetical protein C2G38_2214682 [Gigaspora rosea]
MIEFKYLESAKGSKYRSHLKFDENTWLYLNSVRDINSCEQNNLRLCLNSAESGDSAGQIIMDCGLLNNSTRLHIIFIIRILFPTKILYTLLRESAVEVGSAIDKRHKEHALIRETPTEVDEYMPEVQYIETQQSTHKTNLEPVEEKSIKEDITQIENLDTAILDTEQEKQEGNASVTIQMKSDDNIAEKMGMCTKVLH